MLLTTFKRDGTAVGTPVYLAVDGERGYFRTATSTGKAKRLRNNPGVTLAPATLRGVPTGAPVSGQARVLEGAEARRASRRLVRKYPVAHGLVTPITHRLNGYRTVHYEVTVAPPGMSPC